MNSAKMGHKHACLWLAVMGLIGAASVHAADMKKLQAQSLGVTPGNQLAAKLGLTADNSFVAQGAARTVRGTQVVRMQQYYKGVPVYGVIECAPATRGGLETRGSSAAQHGVGCLPSCQGSATAG